MEEKSISRKEFLKNSTKYAVGVAAGVGAINLLSKTEARAGTSGTPWPWPYVALDTEKVRILGHTSYWSGKGCSYGSFNALMQALRDAVGEPYLSLPSELMIYGAGGTVGWGTLCGGINGPAAVISLVCQKSRSDVLVNELLGWYTQTKFPTDISNQYAKDKKYSVHNYDDVLAQNVSGSPLCHASVTEWCKASGFLASDTARKERCARLTGDVAAYAAQILNDEFASKFTPLYVAPASVAECTTCHSTGTLNKVAAKMECRQCHPTVHKSTAVELVGAGALSYELLQNYPNPFNPTTKIQFSIPKQSSVDLAIYDIHGRLVRTLVAGQEFSQGSYHVDWDGKNNNGDRVATGIYFSRIQAGNYSATKKMTLLK